MDRPTHCSNPAIRSVGTTHGCDPSSATQPPRRLGCHHDGQHRVESCRNTRRRRDAPGTPGTTSSEPAPADDPIAKIADLVAAGRSQLEKVTTYQVLMHRQERVGNEILPAEEVVLSIRRDPKAVRLEWRSGKSRGREVLYSTKETSGQLQIYTPGSLIPRMTLAPDSPLVLRSSRHPITEAGFDGILAKPGDVPSAALGGSVDRLPDGLSRARNSRMRSAVLATKSLRIGRTAKSGSSISMLRTSFPRWCMRPMRRANCWNITSSST